MVDIQPAAAEIRREKKEEEEEDRRKKYIWSALFHRATIKETTGQKYNGPPIT